MQEALIGSGGEEEGSAERLPKEAGVQVEGVDSRQDPGSERPSVEGVAIRAERRLLARPP
jgi:hypothetical protein